MFSNAISVGLLFSSGKKCYAFKCHHDTGEIRKTPFHKIMCNQVNVLLPHKIPLKSKDWCLILWRGNGKKDQCNGWTETANHRMCPLLYDPSMVGVILYHTRSLGALWAPTSRLRPFGPAWGPSGLLDFVLCALRALRPCDPRNDAVIG